jgi:hypothetical protein
MSRYTSLTWNPIVGKSRPDLPDYDKEVLLTVHRSEGDKYQVVTGIRWKTDADGEHWEFKMKNGTPTNWNVIAWAEAEPFTPNN